ncbi:hypothetical protein EMIT0P176_380032 [Pseudomonas sp. IT-P176]
MAPQHLVQDYFCGHAVQVLSYTVGTCSYHDSTPNRCREVVGKHNGMINFGYVDPLDADGIGPENIELRFCPISFALI